MKRKWKILITVGVLVVGSIAVFAGVRYSRRGIVTVQTGRATRQDLTSLVTASGEIKPRKYINIGAKAPRPSTAKAFIDFFLDEESMKIQADTGEFVNRKGVYPPLADADKIKFVQMYSFGKEDFEAKKKEYQKIFFQ